MPWAVSSLLSAVALWRARKQQIRTGIRYFSFAVTLTLLMIATYLAYYGGIGVRTWL